MKLLFWLLGFVCGYGLTVISTNTFKYARHKYYAGMCGVDSCVCYGRLHIDGRLINYNGVHEFYIRDTVGDDLHMDTFVIEGNTKITAQDTAESGIGIIYDSTTKLIKAKNKSHQ